MINNLEDLTYDQVSAASTLAKLLGLGQATEEWLAAQVVLYRTLGMEREVALACMRELARRRALGVVFDFEQYIEDKIKLIKLPEPPNFDQIRSLLSIQSITQMISKSNIGKK